MDYPIEFCLVVIVYNVYKTATTHPLCIQSLLIPCHSRVEETEFYFSTSFWDSSRALWELPEMREGRQYVRMSPPWGQKEIKEGTTMTGRSSSCLFVAE